MRNSSFLIRFIDIGLIILFGFVSVSDLENVSRISVGEVQDELDPSVSDDMQTIVVNIGPAGRFAIDQLSSEPVAGLELLVGVAEMARALEKAIQSRQTNQDGELMVVINPHPDSFVQHTVDVMDVCSRLGVRKTLAR